jgi:hypothetical protein
MAQVVSLAGFIASRSRLVASRSRVIVQLLALTVLSSGCGKQNDAAVAAETDPAAPTVEERRAFASPPPSAVPFAFPADGVGELLRERLTPPRTTPLDPPPFQAGPRDWRAARLGEAFAQRFDSAVEASPRSRVLPQGRGALHVRRAVIDVPPLAAEITPALPERTRFPLGALAFAPGPQLEPSAAAELGPLSSPRAAPGDDPTTEHSRQAALGVIEILRSQAAPFLRFSIPDPHEHERVLPLRTVPVEEVAPLMTTARPASPVLSGK